MNVNWQRSNLFTMQEWNASMKRNAFIFLSRFPLTLFFLSAFFIVVVAVVAAAGDG